MSETEQHELQTFIETDVSNNAGQHEGAPTQPATEGTAANEPNATSGTEARSGSEQEDAPAGLAVPPSGAGENVPPHADATDHDASDELPSIAKEHGIDWRRILNDVCEREDMRNAGGPTYYDNSGNISPKDCEAAINSIKNAVKENLMASGTVNGPDTTNFGHDKTNLTDTGAKPSGEIPEFLRNEAPVRAGITNTTPTEKNQTGTAMNTTRTEAPEPAGTKTAQSTGTGETGTTADFSKYGRQTIDGLKGLAATAVRDAPQALRNGAYGLGGLIGRISRRLNDTSNEPTAASGQTTNAAADTTPWKTDGNQHNPLGTL